MEAVLIFHQLASAQVFWVTPSISPLRVHGILLKHTSRIAMPQRGQNLRWVVRCSPAIVSRSPMQMGGDTILPISYLLVSVPFVS